MALSAFSALCRPSHDAQQLRWWHEHRLAPCQAATGAVLCSHNCTVGSPYESSLCVSTPVRRYAVDKNHCVVDSLWCLVYPDLRFEIKSSLDLSSSTVFALFPAGYSYIVTYKLDADIVFVKKILMLQLNETHFIVIWISGKDSHRLFIKLWLSCLVDQRCWLGLTGFGLFMIQRQGWFSGTILSNNQI